MCIGYIIDWITSSSILNQNMYSENETRVNLGVFTITHHFLFNHVSTQHVRKYDSIISSSAFMAYQKKKTELFKGSLNNI